MTTLQYEITALLSIVFIVMAVFDIRKKILPNKIIVPALVAVPLINGFILLGWQSTLIGGAVGLLIALLFLLIAKFLKSGMGGGDFKLIILIGFAVGYPWVLATLMLGVFTGAAVSMFLLAARKRKPSQGIAFGPYLCISTVLVLILTAVLGG